MEKVEISEQSIYENIKEKYYSKDNKSTIISKVIVPENVLEDYFAAFHSDGVTIYDVSADNGIEEFGSLLWKEFPKMKVRYFKFTTNLTFHADTRFRKLILNDDSRERLIDFVQAETPADIDIVKLKWYNKIPGFRSGTRWKMIMSSILYLWVIAFLVNFVIG